MLHPNIQALRIPLKTDVPITVHAISVEAIVSSLVLGSKFLRLRMYKKKT